jgi:hypothetical protein
MVLPVLPFITVLFCVISITMFKANMNNKKITVLNVVKDLFKYYKTTIMTIFSVLVVISAFSNLGNIPGIISLAILVCIYFGLVSIDLFNPIAENNLSPLVQNQQAKKMCSMNIPIIKKHGILYNLFSGGGMNDLKRDLKKIKKQFE